MAEYIEREKLRKHILEEIELCGEPDASLRPIAYGTILGLKGALSYANTLPTADVVEVVRCKDCEYCIVNENHPDKPLICLMTKMCGTTTPEWFCADGKKKEGAKNGT